MYAELFGFFVMNQKNLYKKKKMEEGLVVGMQPMTVVQREKIKIYCKQRKVFL